ATRRADETYWEEINGVRVPQTEVNFEIPIPLDEHPLLARYAAAHGADCVLYRGPVDRVAIDSYGRLWIVEYKTAKRAEHLHYQTDPQVTTYVWAMQHIYNRPVAGVVYHQFVKDVPSAPKILASGKISTAANQNTSAALYEAALVRMYGAQEKAPEENRRYLTTLMLKEDQDNDRYVQRTYIERNEHMCAAEAMKILLELEDMLNPDLPLYPNPTRDCSRMCSFLGACVSYDDGGDWEETLNLNFTERDQAPDSLWHKRVPRPEVLAQIRRERRGLPDLEDMQARLQQLPKPEQQAVEAGKAPIPMNFMDSDSFTWDMN
ncbi:PD-(D/E)XK nuclease family protein, partial [Parvimonas sp. M20]|uniref:PD-(D/E)XK nuclease family protein n=1 Tax=Parvimonas sp. M20 TaxID=3110693 RepID=UPI002B474C93